MYFKIIFIKKTKSKTMKKNVFKILRLVCWLVFPIVGMNAQPIGFADHFSSLSSQWYGTTSYVLSVSDTLLDINCQKAVWDEFGITLKSAVNISANPRVTFKFKAGIDCYVNAALVDSAGDNNRYTAPRVKITGGANFVDVTFNFSETAVLGSVNATQVKTIVLIINPDYDYSGMIYMADFRVGNVAPNYPSVWLPRPIYLTEGKANQSITLSHLETGASVTATSSNIAVIPNPTVSGNVVTFNPVAGPTDSAIITLNIGGTGYTTLHAPFTAYSYANLAPTIKKVNDAVCGSGVPFVINLDSMYGGNPDRVETLTVTATSSDTTIIRNSKLKLALSPLKSQGTLTMTPEVFLNGSKTCKITVKVQDNSGTAHLGVDTAKISFNVTVWASYYMSPTINPIPDNNFGYANDLPVTVNLTGITDGNGGNKVASVTASSTGGAITTPIVVSYTPGMNTATLTYKVNTASAGLTSVVTVDVTNTGAPGNSNGNSTTSTSFNVVGVAPAITGYIEPFDTSTIYGSGYYTNPNYQPPRPLWGTTTSGLWPGHWWIEGQGSYQTLVVDTTNKSVTIACAMTQPYTGEFSGTWWSARKIFDLSTNPYLSVTLSRTNATKSTPGIAIDLFDVNGLRYGLAERKTVTTTAVNYTYTFFNPVLNADGQTGTIDMSKIAVILFNFDDYDSTYSGNVTISQLQVGDLASNAPAPPSKYVSFDSIGNRTITESTDAQLIHVLITNIQAMQSATVPLSEPVTLTASSNNTSLIPAPVISDIVNGQAYMDLTPAVGVTGTAKITVTGTANGCTNAVWVFTVNVVAPVSGTAINIAVTPTTTFQTITAFGLMLGASPSDVAIQDLGASAFRIFSDGSLGLTLESVNDNQDPNILDLSKFQFSQATITEAQQAIALGVNKFFLTVLTAPYWTKKNLSGSVPFYSDNDNFVDTTMYAEFAEWVAGTCLSFKEATGVDVYAVSVQNEPQFDEIYGSGNYTGPELNNLARVTGQKLRSMGIPTRLFFAENLPAQGAVLSFDQDVLSDTATTTLVEAFAIHNPTIDAIASIPGSACTTWASILDLAEESPVKQNWMTEGDYTIFNISNAINDAGGIYEALTCGNVNLWAPLDMDRTYREVFGVHKNFFYVKPGAVRIEAVPTSTNILAVAFQSVTGGDSSFVIVAINREATAQQVKITGIAPSKFRLVQTSANQYAEEEGVVFSTNNYTTVLPANSVTTFIGNNANIAPAINQAANQLNICSNGTQNSVTLTGISPVESNQLISSITAASSNQSIISDVNLSVSSVTSGTATLTYTPVTGANGVAIISVTVVDNGGTANGGVNTTIMTFEVQVVDCQKLTETNKAQFSLYPNPATDNVTVSLASDKGGIISVVDLQGRLVLEQTVAAGQQDVLVNLQSIAKGAYILKVNNGTYSSTAELIKE